MGEPLKPDELEAFTRFTGRTIPPDRRVDEMWFCVGRRGGKSKASDASEARPAWPCWLMNVLFGKMRTVQTQTLKS
jgi:hypothetical protein